MGKCARCNLDRIIKQFQNKAANKGKQNSPAVVKKEDPVKTKEKQETLKYIEEPEVIHIEPTIVEEVVEKPKKTVRKKVQKIVDEDNSSIGEEGI